MFMLPNGFPEPMDCCSWSRVIWNTADVCLESVVWRCSVPMVAQCCTYRNAQQVALHQ
jgi:hypothetical protein